MRPFLLLSLLLVFSFFSTETRAQQPSNPNATEKTQEVYRYLVNYKRDPSKCYIIGQSLGHKNQIVAHYTDYIVKLDNELGKTPGLVGGDLGLEGFLDTASIVDLYTSYFENGGLVTLSWQSLNPWSGTYDADPNNYRDFRRLLNPTDPLYAVWMSELDKTASILQKLRDNGVTVLWRPFSDMNGNWFWWGAHPQRDPDDFIALWHQMYDYFTNVKGLNNLLWVFSVNQSTILDADPGYWLHGNIYYPGTDYVDIVGITVFDDDLKLYDPADYQSLKAFNKPLALSICGPNPATATGNYDYFHFYKKLKEKYPEAVYVLIGHSYADVKMALTDNLNYDKLLQIDCIINRGEIDLSQTWENFETPLKDLHIFPMPASDQFFITSDQFIEGPVQIQLMDVSGHTVFSKAYEYTYYMEVNARLPAGMYYVQISTPTDVLRKKIVFQ